MDKKGTSVGVESITKKNTLRTLLEAKELTIFIIVLLFGTILSFATPYFLTSSNLLIILNGMALNMIMATGLTISLIGGHTDFSIGSIFGCSAFAAGLLMEAGQGVVFSICVGLLFGTFLGAINGILVVKIKVLPIVVTMGTWMAYKGLGLIMVGNRALSGMPASFKAIAQKWSFFGLPTIIFLMLVIMILGIFALKYIKFFHESFFIGGNIESAKLAGINVNRFIIIAYMINGFLAAFAGILMLSRIGSAPSTMGQGLEFQVITALLIGGVSFSGGEGSILGAFLGCFLMGMISNALSIFGINANMQQVIIGTILVFAVAMDESNRRRKERK